MTKLIDILHALCLALTAWLQGRRTARRRAANRAIAEGDAKTLNDHYERTLNE